MSAVAALCVLWGSAELGCGLAWRGAGDRVIAADHFFAAALIGILGSATGCFGPELLP